ncbi:MAG: hypothetical protein GEV03_06740 [Streptosporangiales bacterium]|nr:hypothetical protein [Streptosporangiales bacterium]
MDFERFTDNRGWIVKAAEVAEWLRSKHLPEMAELVLYLHGRLAEDEEAAKEAPDPKRALREISFKQQLLAAYVSAGMYQRHPEFWDAYAEVICDLAEFVYEDHQEPREDCLQCNSRVPLDPQRMLDGPTRDARDDRERSPAFPAHR